jgi:chromosome segregation protein
MYLKSIEAHGFKAFANKIRLEFNQGITGIVGPNGSGKSNIADAVRWVLGEQSAKQLRGSSMQDVIFSGTENRKPLGFAYVTLTLDNSDKWLPITYDEVTVGRRVYRSGESEYMINGNTCRLRDVQELFFDTGVGKEGYSIIGQGQIDKILSGKPEERREIFDEAAGIVKYKKRKSAAEKNLEAEKQNLDRVNDIIYEIEKQIGPLTRQYEKAKVYLKLKEELKGLEISKFVNEYDKNNQELATLSEKLSIVQGDLEQSRKQYETAKAEYEALLNELQKKQELLDQTREERNQAALDKQNAENDVKIFSEQILTIKAGEEHFASRMEGIELRRNNYNDELAVYNTNIEKAKADIVLLKEKCDASEAKLNEKRAEITKLMEEESAISKNRIETLSENTKVRTELERINTMGEQYAIRRAEINARILALKSEMSLNQSNLNEAKEELKRISGEVIEAAKACDEKDSSNKELSIKIHEKDDLRQRKRQEVLVTQSKVDTLKNLSERYEGYGQAVRRVMEERKSYPGIEGVVADLIKTENGLETAIETALGGNIQNIVTNTQATAKQCIEFLKKGRFGRATFLPLDGIKAKRDEFDSNVMMMKGVIGSAADLVKYDSKYEEAIRYLLGRFLVVDTIDNAIKIEQKFHYKYRIVTKDGELFQPGGAISGGAFKNNSNLLGRKRELEQLEESLVKGREEIKLLETEIDTMRATKTANTEKLTELRSTLSEKYVEQNTAKINLVHADEASKDLEKRNAALNEELNALDNENATLKATLAELGVKIEENTALNEEEEEKAKVIADKLAAAREEEAGLTQLNVNDITAYNTAMGDVNHIQDNIDRVNNELSGLDNEENELKRTKADSINELSERERAIERAREKAERLERRIKRCDKSIEELQGISAEMTKQNKSFFELSENLSERISALDKEEFRLKAANEKLAEAIDYNIRYMWEEYELTISSAKELVIDTGDTEATKKNIQELRSKIRGLGDVNVNAIEEYRETSERYEFLKTQRDDIVKAEKVLEGIIEELDVDMRKQFLLTFDEIGKRFDHTFKELFGGGKGTLELTEDEDVLEAGIRIIAQPPGKKLQNMMQLSGGEKALTAIALLFAILDLKPSPFCLLDEIEAALDDSNVSRFANYLQKLTSNTQFIVITHRRGTMAAADALYGITMQEKGVSTLVSVNLVESALK